MDKIKQTFLDSHPEGCVSLFMPTHRAGRETEQNPIRFKNLLREVEERLLDKGLRSPEVRHMLKQPLQLLRDTEFWRYQNKGLAVFFSADSFSFFRVPIPMEELIVISRRFHVKPLLPVLAVEGTFYILALSQNEARLLEGTRYMVEEIDLKGVVPSFSEALPDAASGKQLQFHTGTPSGPGSRAAVFYGHDISKDTKDRILRWFRMIDRQLRDFMSGEQSPLVLAGVDYLFPLYKEANTYPHVMVEGVPGNPEGLKPEELHSRAWGLVEPVFRKAREEALARYRELAGTGWTTNNLKEAVLAAHHGRVDVLFVAVGVHVWGQFDPENERVILRESPEPGDEDLLDLSAIQSLIHGGTVYAVSPEEVPDQASLAAVFRY